MELVSKMVGDAILFTFKGRLDAMFSEEMEKQIREMMYTNRRAVVVNLKEADYISSSGLRILLEVAKNMQAKDGKLVLCEVQPQVRQIIRLAGFDKILTILPTEADAFAHVRE